MKFKSFSLDLDLVERCFMRDVSFFDLLEDKSVLIKRLSPVCIFEVAELFHGYFNVYGLFTHKKCLSLRCCKLHKITGFREGTSFYALFDVTRAKYPRSDFSLDYFIDHKVDTVRLLSIARKSLSCLKSQRATITLSNLHSHSGLPKKFSYILKDVLLNDEPLQTTLAF